MNKELVDLVSWIDNNGLKGWDPYDIRGSKISLKIQKLPYGIFGKLIRKLFNISIAFLPNLSRKILNIKPLENAKGIGLILTSYSILYRKTNEDIYLQKALECANKLEKNKGTVYSGYNWGYPFDWQSAIFIPKGTPSSVVTYTVGNGFYELYKVTGDKKYLDICKEICNFFVNELNITFESNNALCYSYTPIDDYQVHNANLFVGAFLVKIGKEVENREWVDKGIKCANFAIQEQQEDGYLPYWGLSQTEDYSNGIIKVDHYHSGFEIRMLFSIWNDTQDEKIKTSWKRYFKWYKKEMFTSDGIPKLTPTNFYPVNIHSIAESMICLGTLNQYFKSLDSDIKIIEKYTTKKMQYKTGEYCYMIIKLPFVGEYKIKIPMLRWGQAWMLYAYSINLKDKNEK